MGKIGAAIGSAALGGVTGGIGSAIGGAIGLLNPFSWGSGKKRKKEQIEAEQRQHQYELEKMGLQKEYNQEQAKFNQGLALDLWEKTNYGAQLKHMKENGLNTALMYGQPTGIGGTTTGAGTAEGVSMGTSGAVGVGLQARLQDAQIEATRAAANKANAEAAKISGTDQQNTQANTDLTKANENLSKASERLANAKGDQIKVEMDKVEAERNILIQNLRKVTNDADISDATKQAEIDKAFWTNQKIMFDGLEALSQGKLNEKMLSYVDTQIKWYAYNAKSERIKANAADKAADASGVSAEAAKSSSEAYNKNVETFAQRLKEEMIRWDKSLAQADERILMDWIYRGISSATDIVDTGLNVYTRGLSGAVKGAVKSAQGAAPTGGQAPAKSPTASPSGGGGRAVTYNEYRSLVERAKKGGGR